MRNDGIFNPGRGVGHAHTDLIERYGESSGFRDARVSVVPAPNGYYANLIEEAAALWESLSQNDAFVDGNKRTAFAATYTSLAINGVQMITNSHEAYAFITGLYAEGEF